MIRTALILAAAASLGSAAQAATRYTITDLGTTFTPSEINDSGWIVGRNLSHAFVRTADGTMIDLGDLGTGANASFGNGINNLGTAVGSSAVPGGANAGTHAFTWTQADGIVDIGEPAGGTERAAAQAINNLGQVVGTGSSSGSSAFLWTQAGGFKLLSGLAGTNSASAVDISDAGFIAGGSSIPGGSHAVRWGLDGSVTDLGDLPGGANDSFAAAINEAGQIVGQSESASGRRAFLWTEAAGMRDLGVLAAASRGTAAADINDAGVVIGSNQDNLIQSTAFVWTEAFGMRDLNSLTDTNSAWHLSSTFSINNNNQIVGSGELNGRSHYFLLNPYEAAGVPEPASWALMIGGFGLAGTQLRRRKATLASA
jgi:probable HAF family extracellular repeat protein